MRIKSVCIDPGHGGIDNGAAWGHAEEDDINLAVAYLLRCLIQIDGTEVWMTRENDIYVPLEARCTFANGVGAGLFVSIHCDAWHNETTRGISTHIHTGAGVETEAIAKRIHTALMAAFPSHVNRGVKRSNFYVLNPRRTRMPAILVECEFISNPDMRRWLSEPEHQFAIAHAISGGIINRI